MRDAWFDRVVQLSRDAAAAMDPKMKWMWGEALFGYALSELDALLGADEFTPFLTAYCDYYVAHPPIIDYADRAAPALITYAMQKKTGNPDYARLTQRVLDYIQNEPRLIGDAVNHLGSSLEGRWYPKSIWVDSLMMFSVFPALYARENRDAQLLDFAARQVGVYSQYMQDPADRLWYHSYWVKAGRHHPKAKVYWGRGNGWVVCALPMILRHIGADHLEFEGILRIYRETVEAVLKTQLADGTFRTVLNKPSYRELSATALIAAGILDGVRRGWLDQKHLPAGIRAFRAVVDSFGQGKNGLFMPEISAPTIPLHILPLTCYRLTPKGNNWPYGLAAVIFAAIAYAQLE